MLNPPKLIGHRGVKNLSPENTLNSIELAHKLGLKWIEIDVKISKDLVPILLHDDTLERTTDGKGLPTDFNYDDLKKLDAGFSFYNYSTNICIPTLKQVLLFCKKNEIGLNIELKPNLGFEKNNVEAIAKLLSNFNFTNQYYFSSFDWPSVILMKKFLPILVLCLLSCNASFGDTLRIIDGDTIVINEEKFVSLVLMLLK